MHQIKTVLVVLAIVVVSAISFESIAQDGQVLGFNTYNRCIDDSDCSAGKICVNGQCIKEGQGCVVDSDCSAGKSCVNGKCQETKEQQGCVDDSDCDYGGYCIMGICRMKKGWW